jgi:hypothetical protein
MKPFVKTVAVLALSAASLSAFAMSNTGRYGEAASPAAAELFFVLAAIACVMLLAAVCMPPQVLKRALA